MERLEREVRQAARRAGLPAAGELVRVWPVVVGDTIAANAWPARLTRAGVLQVNTTSAIWAFELMHLAPRILEKLRQALPEECPRELRFSAGPVPGEGGAKGPADVPLPPTVTPRDRSQAVRLAASIGDEELRALVARAAAASLAQRP